MDVVDDVDDEDIVGDEDIVLSREERELLVWLSRGYDVAHIAERTCYSDGWTYTRLRNVRVALGVRIWAMPLAALPTAVTVAPAPRKRSIMPIGRSFRGALRR